MTKHTAGPWRVVNDASVVARIDRPGEDRESLVVRLDSSSTANTKTQNIANARLIAAAPEMLEALKALLPYVEKYDQPGERWARLCIEQVIAKAEGGQG